MNNPSKPKRRLAGDGPTAPSRASLFPEQFGGLQPPSRVSENVWLGNAVEAASLRHIRPGQLPPRERVRYFYLRMLARADSQGVTRPQAATPSEFVRVLDEEWPDAGTDLEDLTEAFVLARYGARDLESEEVSTAQELWRRVMRALRVRPPSDASAD